MRAREMTPQQAADDYEAWVRRTGFSEQTMDQYVRQVRAFCDWLAAAGPSYAEALSDEFVRDYAARDYRRELLTVRKHRPATVATALSAVGSLYRRLGMVRPNVPSLDVAHEEMKALTEADMRAVLRAAQRRGPRDLAVVAVGFLAAPRVAEIAALDTDDVFVSERKGQLSIRYGKGGRSRKVPLGPQCRAALGEWLAERPTWRNAGTEQALFLATSGRRLAVRSLQHVVSQSGQAAGVHVTPHVLRHTFGRRYTESGGDLVALQRLLGHKNVQTTAGYARPSGRYLEESVAALDVDL